MGFAMAPRLKTSSSVWLSSPILLLRLRPSPNAPIIEP
eukprot:CAMPEP_0174751186 /NCGR_PEP_ID=MMETSP1094-20130205/99284_1 /TAXON_ID=156173 /ORGANISM="Chrysochromulina brevifilum, Strain UTEX LB 985" /LENGTH=37 /DNA_ID= /DNA_START= /DNA_END= /DNA_ORIENTATION=